MPNGITTYHYIYNGSQLTGMTVDGHTLYFSYDAAGTPMSVNYDGTEYYYITNLQGDVTGIVKATGETVVTYSYDAWGNILSTAGTDAATLGAINPLRYRGYVYDEETRLYYLQSRYYNPGLGRFINADGFVSTGQGLLGFNMFAYCGNNPVNNVDPAGTCFYNTKGQWCHDNWEYIGGYVRKPDPGTFAIREELAVISGASNKYKGITYYKTNIDTNASFSFGSVWLGADITEDHAGAQLIRHEYGHTRQLEKMGAVQYTFFVVIPSVSCYTLDAMGKSDAYYFSLPWEYEADVLGNATQRRKYTANTKQGYFVYKFFISLLFEEGGDMKYASKLNP